MTLRSWLALAARELRGSAGRMAFYALVTACLIRRKGEEDG